MSTNVETTYIARSFIDLLSDAVTLAVLCQDESMSDERQNAVAKASILNCIFSLECAANCCLERMSYSRRMMEKIDRFPPLDKFEFLSIHISDNRFDRGRSEIQNAAELFQIRNEFVHPRKREIPTKFLPDNILEFSDAGDWPGLRIAKSPSRWEHLSAQRVLMGADAFLTHFFLDLCEFTPSATTEWLLSGIIVSGKLKQAYPAIHRENLRNARQSMAIPFRFFDLDREFDEFVRTKDSSLQ